MADERNAIETTNAPQASEQQPGGEESNVSRRDMLKLTAAAALTLPLISKGSASAAEATTNAALQWKAPQFFTKEEFAMVDELGEIIIPTDEHSPGARAAGCAAYIDSQVAESWTDEPKKQWRDGLKLIDSISQEMNSKPFMQATPEQRVAVVTRISQNEMNPQKPEEHFFREIKGRVAHAYYSSKIGIHQEMEYKGNVPIKEFAGIDVSQSS
jgi:hypothetical protein